MVEVSSMRGWESSEAANIRKGEIKTTHIWIQTPVITQCDVTEVVSENILSSKLIIKINARTWCRTCLQLGGERISLRVRHRQSCLHTKWYNWEYWWNSYVHSGKWSHWASPLKARRHPVTQAKRSFNRSVGYNKGQQEVELPWQHNAPKLPDNKRIPQKSFESLKRKLNFNVTLFRGILM